MSKIEANPEIERILEIESLAQLHQSVFEDIYSLALRQENGWENSPTVKPNPELFVQIEQILLPLYLAWREKYALIRRAIIEGRVPYFDVIKSFALEKETSEKVEEYFINYGEEIDYPAIDYNLQIRKPGIRVVSRPSTTVSGYQKGADHWEERFDFSANFNNSHRRDMRLQIKERAGFIHSLNHVTHSKDQFSLNLSEEITPSRSSQSNYTKLPILQRQIHLSVWQPSPADSLPPRRLVDDLSGTISDLRYKIIRESFFNKVRTQK